MADRALLEGHVSIEAALRARSRPIHRVLIAAEGVRADRAAQRIQALASRQELPVVFLERAEIDRLASGRSHGGTLAEVGERYHVELEELAADDPFVVMLDGIEDPYNYGAALRSLYAAGATGLVARPRAWGPATAVVTRASAGASELLPSAVVESPVEALDVFARAGLRTVVAAERSESVSLYEVDLAGPLFVLIGGERRGVTRPALDAADVVMRIPYARDAPSLGTAAATAVIAFEVMRQRGAVRLGAAPRPTRRSA